MRMIELGLKKTFYTLLVMHQCIFVRHESVVGAQAIGFFFGAGVAFPN